MRAAFTTARTTACALIWAAASSGATAQTTLDAGAFQNQFPDPVRYTQPVPESPELEVTLVAEIALSGPVVSSPRLVDGRIEILTGSGLVRATWIDEPRTVPVPLERNGAGVEPDVTWALGPGGVFRAEAVEGRQLVVQKACRGCSKGWRRRWRLRVPGLAPTAPVITARRVYYGAADNRVYGVRRKNGHRVWATALDGRVLRPLSLWVAPGQSPDAAAAILAVPEPGKELVVLDALAGRPSLRYRLQGAGDEIVGAALATPDGHVILGRQGYTREDAGLIVLRIGQTGLKPDPTARRPATGYNPPTSDEANAEEPPADPPGRYPGSIARTRIPESDFETNPLPAQE